MNSVEYKIYEKLVQLESFNMWYYNRTAVAAMGESVGSEIGKIKAQVARVLNDETSK